MAIILTGKLYADTGDEILAEAGQIERGIIVVNNSEKTSGLWSYKDGRASGTRNGDILYVKDTGEFYEYNNDTYTLISNPNLAYLNSPTFTGTPRVPTASSGDNTTQIANTQFVQSAIESKLAANDAMIFKGTLGTGGTTSFLPSTHNAGWTYKVITAGTYAGVTCEVGDLIICIADGTSTNDAHWTVVQTNEDGVVSGPTSSTEGHIAVFNSTNGTLIKDSGYTIASIVYSHPNHAAHTGVPSANQTPAFGGSFTVNQINNDAEGHVTANTSRSITIPNTLSNGSTTAGLIKTSSTVTNSTGYTASPVINGVPYYKDTNAYHTSGSWSGLTYTATANGGAGELKFTLPTGTGSNQVAKGDHNHDAKYVSINAIIPMVNGGTGATTAAEAVSNLGFTLTAEEICTSLTWGSF